MYYVHLFFVGVKLSVVYYVHIVLVCGFVED